MTWQHMLVWAKGAQRAQRAQRYASWLFSSLLTVCTLSSALFIPCYAEDIIYPPDVGAGVINVVAQYGAKGDGTTDDTAAIQKAISDNISTFAPHYSGQTEHILY